MLDGLVDLLRVLAVHPDVLRNVVQQHKPTSSPRTCWIWRAYSFYRDCPVIVDGRAHALHAAVSERAREVLHAGLTGLGLVPLERMQGPIGRPTHALVGFRLLNMLWMVGPNFELFLQFLRHLRSAFVDHLVFESVRILSRLPS